MIYLTNKRRFWENSENIGSIFDQPYLIMETNQKYVILDPRKVYSLILNEVIFVVISYIEYC